MADMRASELEATPTTLNIGSWKRSYKNTPVNVISLKCSKILRILTVWLLT